MNVTPSPSDQPKPVFDPSAPHHQRPRLRPVRLFPANVGGQQAVGISDSRQISDRIVATSPAFQVILPLMDGSRTVDEVVTQIGRGLTRAIIEPFIAQLDDAGLMFGPTFDAMVAAMKRDFDSQAVLPPASTAQFAEAVALNALGKDSSEEDRTRAAPTKLREWFDLSIDQALQSADNPSFDALPKAIVAPHLDYPRGGVNYAAVYGRLRVVDRPDRVVILGTNHFGEGTGVVGCDKGYETVLGVCDVDKDLVELLRAKLGEPLFQCRYDHEREHSIELHIPWIQHCLGEVGGGGYPKVFGALIHDPAVNNGESYDGKGVGLGPFIQALRDALAALPGKSLIVASADLSHVGPAFGDKFPLAGEKPEVEQFRAKVFQHDKEMLALIRDNKPDELIAAMAWQQNPTRWCSVGNLTATMKLVEPDNIEILNFSGAMDQEGMAMVTSAAMVMT